MNVVRRIEDPWLHRAQNSTSPKLSVAGPDTGAESRFVLHAKFGAGKSTLGAWWNLNPTKQGQNNSFLKPVLEGVWNARNTMFTRYCGITQHPKVLRRVCFVWLLPRQQFGEVTAFHSDVQEAWHQRQFWQQNQLESNECAHLPVLWPDITFLGPILCADFIFEMPFPTEKTSLGSKWKNRAFRNIWRLGVPMGFLIADSESTQNVGSIRALLPPWHFLGGSYQPILFLRPKQVFAVR